MWQQHQLRDDDAEHTPGPEGPYPPHAAPAGHVYPGAASYAADPRTGMQTPLGWRPAAPSPLRPHLPAAVHWGAAYPISPVGWGGQHIVAQTATRAPGFARDRGRMRLRGGGPRASDFGRGGRGRGAPLPGAGIGGSETTIDEILWHVSRVPPHEPALPVIVPLLQIMDSRTTASLFKELARAGLYWRACQVFDWLRHLPLGHDLRYHCDVFTYTAMISLCVDPRQLDRALELSEEMRVNGIERNVHTYSALMNVCIKCGQHQLALEVYGQMQQYGCQPNVVTYNTLIDVYGKTGQWAEARKVLDDMMMQGIEPVTRTYNTLMIACNTSGQWQEALHVFNKMIAAGHQPNTTTFNALISAYSKAGRLEKVLEAYQEMVRSGCERSVITYSSLISACERAGQWEMALTLFQDMHKDGCVPNVITYNSLITACGQGLQWERAQEVFEQMQKHGCSPDVVTYTALIGAYERGGQWRLALDAFQAMVRQGCRPDIIVYNAILDVLWDTGIVWAQRKACLLYRAAAADGHFRRTAVSGGDVVDLNLHSLTSGTAMLSLFCWLADLREQVLLEGASCLASTMGIIMGRPKQRDHAGSSVIRDAVTALLEHCGSPFRSTQDLVNPGRLEASGAQLAEWLQQEHAQKLLRMFAAGRLPAELEYEPQREVAVEQQSGEAFSGIKVFESTHCLNVRAMGLVYVQSRAATVEAALQTGETLGLKSVYLHDAVLLLDRAASTGMNLLEPDLPACLYACLRITIQQSDSAEGAATDKALASAAGTSVQKLYDMEARMRSALEGDTASISALRCLNLYLERIGLDPAQGRLAPDEAPMDIFRLMSRALLDPEFLNYRPSVVAAAALYCDRLHRGLLPFWPSSLATLTGYSNAHTPELLAAIGGAQRLYTLPQPASAASSPAPATGLPAASGISPLGGAASLSPREAPPSQPTLNLAAVGSSRTAPTLIARVSSPTAVPSMSPSPTPQ